MDPAAGWCLLGRFKHCILSDGLSLAEFLSHRCLWPLALPYRRCTASWATATAASRAAAAAA
jgi:hypothetical protein